jgi:16S rRNA (guanine527-N7)-methyltransferase
VSVSLDNVSRETQERLAVIVAQVEKWQKHINLIAPSTLPVIWQRHVADSLQLIALASSARRWLDLGSGGGFPGLVVAAVLAEHHGSQITLVESNQKKCSFLRETARLAGLPVTVLALRIDQATPELAKFSWDVVSARALASFDQLLHMASPFIGAGAVGLFPKGRDVDDEVKLAQGTWNFSHDLIQSITEPMARIVRVTAMSHRELSSFE